MPVTRASASGGGNEEDVGEGVREEIGEEEVARMEQEEEDYRKEQQELVANTDKLLLSTSRCHVRNNDEHLRKHKNK